MRFGAMQARACLSGVRRFVAAACGLLALASAGSAAASINASMTLTPVGGYANPIMPGDVTAIRISLTNDNSANAVTSVGFTANLSAGLKVVRVVPGS